MSEEIAIIVPVHNEADNVLPLAREIRSAAALSGLTYILVFVDDASTDSTWEQIRKAHLEDPGVQGLRHSAKAGQSAALWTGFKHVKSPILATMDGDRQNDPSDLAKLLKALDKADFVCGFRAKRHDGWVRKASSIVARVARSVMLGSDFKDTGCAMRVFRQECLQAVFPFNGLHRFMPILVKNGGYATLEVPVNHRARVSGVSKYGIWNRLWRGLLDLLAMAWYARRQFVRLSTQETIPEPLKKG